MTTVRESDSGLPLTNVMNENNRRVLEDRDIEDINIKDFNINDININADRLDKGKADEDIVYENVENREGAGRTYSFEELLDSNGFIVYTNVGISMMPLLRQRKDIIEIRKRGPGRLKKYDVVLYKRGGKYILHRILKVRPDDYVIAGDHNTFLEYGITDADILGVMTRVIRDGREIHMTDPEYLAYVHLWCDFYPVRIFILRCKRLAARVVRHIFKHRK